MVTTALLPPPVSFAATSQSGRPAVLYVSAVAEMKGGAEAVLVEMLRNPGVRPVLAVPGSGSLAAAAADLGVQVVEFDMGAVAEVRRPINAATVVFAARDTLRVARQLTRLARNNGANLVHTNGLKVNVAGCLAHLLSGTPVVVHVHDVPYSPVERLIWRALHAGATHTVAASPICYPALVGRSSRLSVVMQGVADQPVEVPRSLPTRPTVGFVGRIHPFKGVHLLIEWFDGIKDQFPQVNLLVRGRADAEGSAYWEQLQPRFEALAREGRCRVEGWRRPDEDPLADIDILAAPSVAPEAGPRVIMEAMLRAIPAVGYPAGGGLHMIPTPEVGALASDRGSFAAALSRLLDPAIYASVSAAALTHARREFAVDRFWRDLSGAYAAMSANGIARRAAAS